MKITMTNPGSSLEFPCKPVGSVQRGGLPAIRVCNWRCLVGGCGSQTVVGSRMRAIGTSERVASAHCSVCGAAAGVLTVEDVPVGSLPVPA